MNKEPNPFFVMPGSALIDLREELELIEDDKAKETLARYGYRAGVGLIKSLDVEVPSFEQFKDVLPQLWSETGLGRMRLIDADPERIKVAFEESIEASPGRRCDFTRGYLAGMVSTLMKRKFEAQEMECIADGKDRCIHELRPAEGVQKEAKPRAEGERKNQLEPGYSYLVESEDIYAGFDVFLDYVSHGSNGLWISREYPEKVKKRFEIGDFPHLWLSYERDISYAREPTNIPLIYAEVKGFLDNSQGGIVLLSGLEYLMSQNTFLKVLKFLQLLNENVAVKDALLVIPLSPQALSPREVKMLERELRVHQPM
jgi:predicted hydrocarbon binding protein